MHALQLNMFGWSFLLFQLEPSCIFEADTDVDIWVIYFKNNNNNILDFIHF